MSDIVERLRALEGRVMIAPAGMLDEAAKTIESLRAVLNVHGGRYWEGRWRDADAEVERLRAALERARTILTNMALEYERSAPWMRRWHIPHEPLRADAKNLLPTIDAALK